MAVAAMVVVLAVVPDGMVSAVSGAFGVTSCPPRDTRVLARYPITGYWVIPRADRCVTQALVEAVHGMGGDTLITFGARIEPARVNRAGRVTGESAADFAGCAEKGRTCYQAALDAAGGKPIRQVYTYVTSERFGEGVIRCPGLDRRVESGGRVYYRLLLGSSCAAPHYDLVLVATDGDGVGDLLAEAAAYGMRVFPGLPVPPKDPVKPWLPDLAHLPALNDLTGRVLADYRRRHGASPALGGVYQSFELAMRDRAPDDPIIALYAAQHAVVAATLPGTKIMVSPYWDARRDRGFGPERVGEGFADIAGTRAGAPMAIAIQDGRGVGKVPVYGPDQADAPIAPRLMPVVGPVVGPTAGPATAPATAPTAGPVTAPTAEPATAPTAEPTAGPVTAPVSNRRAYYGSTRDYIEAAARRVAPGVELWVNVEVFEPTQVAGECGRANPFPLRGRTSKSRVDEQVAAVGRNASKIIAYGWDPFLTCRRGATPSLADDLVAGGRQPIVAGAYSAASGGRTGIMVEGYHLGGGQLRFTYHARGAGARTVTVPQQWHDPRTGDADRMPDGLESAWAPFAAGDLDPARPWITITATNGAGHTSTGGYAFDGRARRG